MKAQNKEEKLAKAQEREKLQREIALREKAERMQVETYACIINGWNFFWDMARPFLASLAGQDSYIIPGEGGNGV